MLTYRRLAGLTPTHFASFAGPSVQLRLVSSAFTKRVPPPAAASCFASFGDKTVGQPDKLILLRMLSFVLSRKTSRARFGHPVARKTPVLKLDRGIMRKPPAATASELSRRLKNRKSDKPVIGRRKE